MQLLLALLASAALAVACLPTQDRSPNPKEVSDREKNASNSYAVYPAQVLGQETGTETETVVVPKTERAAIKIVSSWKPRTNAQYSNQKPKPTTTKRPTTTTTQRSWDYYDYFNDDPRRSKMTHGYDKPPPPPPLCPGDGFMCTRDCEGQNFYSGYCDGNQCICYGKLVG